MGDAWWKMVFSFELLHKGKGRVINIPQTVVVRDKDKGNLYLSNGFFLTSQIPFHQFITKKLCFSYAL